MFVQVFVCTSILLVQIFDWCRYLLKGPDSFRELYEMNAARYLRDYFTAYEGNNTRCKANCQPEGSIGVVRHASGLEKKNPTELGRPRMVHHL